MSNIYPHYTIGFYRSGVRKYLYFESAHDKYPEIYMEPQFGKYQFLSKQSTAEAIEQLQRLNWFSENGISLNDVHIYQIVITAQEV